MKYLKMGLAIILLLFAGSFVLLWSNGFYFHTMHIVSCFAGPQGDGCQNHVLHWHSWPLLISPILVLLWIVSAAFLVKKKLLISVILSLLIMIALTGIIYFHLLSNPSVVRLLY